LDIPSICHLRNSAPHPSCMLCVVEEDSGRLIPSCAAAVRDGISVFTDSERVKTARRGAVELLLSEHAGDCRAPCVRACPFSADIPGIMSLVSRGRFEDAGKLVSVIPGECSSECSLRCEKACRRSRYDLPVSIREIIRVVKKTGKEDTPGSEVNPEKRFDSGLGRVSDEELGYFLSSALDAPRGALKGSGYTKEEAASESMRCLSCGCLKPDTCRLRQYAEKYGAVQRRRGGERISFRRVLTEKYVFEQGKCVKCGICVRISAREGVRYGFAFTGRGFSSRAEAVFGRYSDPHLSEIAPALVKNCPTGAISDPRRLVCGNSGLRRREG